MKQRIAIAVLIGLVCGLGFGVHAQPSGAATYETFSTSHITSAATTTPLTGPGTLHTLCVNKLGTTSDATIYNNTAASGTVIAVIDTTKSVNCQYYDAAMSTGLTVVTTGSGMDLTVSYRALR